ncbi:MAG: tRNA pseudouridine(38-40) synthase TruA [Lachnospiraceae bacterium]|nr:tRNA pseudouridine(38-40) synthase TruA [Lachnospiraceae bacterium]MBO7601392.1 tRNA pseudouridine(38-40) synthase TruA [Lachnospiraceae bacterium]
MKRVLLCVAYDGTAYSGWQLQDNAPSIEGELNKALSDIHGEEIRVIGASRTDAGVHALCNMAVYDTDARMPGEKVSFALNTRLPDDIRAVWSKEVPDDFHPRHMLTEKTYEYRIWNADFMPPTKRLYYYHVSKLLDVEAMKKASECLVGEHDFKSFSSIYTTAETTVRNITGIEVVKERDEVFIRVSGNGFLYNMVRIIAGTLIEVGLKRKDEGYVKAALEALNREAAGPTAPAHGLLLKDFRFME